MEGIGFKSVCDKCNAETPTLNSVHECCIWADKNGWDWHTPFTSGHIMKGKKKVPIHDTKDYCRKCLNGKTAQETTK